jgi:hypothetical protein
LIRHICKGIVSGKNGAEVVEASVETSKSLGVNHVDADLKEYRTDLLIFQTLDGVSLGLVRSLAFSQ